MAVTRTLAALALFWLAPAGAARAQVVIPEWAKSAWTIVAKSRALAISSRIKPAILQGDFDGDGKIDIAVFVESAKSHQQGIVFLHQGTSRVFVVGAGTPLGNGGDDFEWMDSWSIKAHGPKSRSDAVLVSREGSASGLVIFANGRYRWKQQGD